MKQQPSLKCQCSPQKTHETRPELFIKSKNLPDTIPSPYQATGNYKKHFLTSRMEEMEPLVANPSRAGDLSLGIERARALNYGSQCSRSERVDLSM